jgi:hypothetical protein
MIKKVLFAIALVLFAVPASADVASQLVRAGVNTVAAEILAEHLAVSYGTVAAAGTVTGDATAITKRATYVTASDDAKGVILPAAVSLGLTYDVFNTVASKDLKIYPSTGGQINAGGANVPIVINGKSGVRCLYGATDTWQCAQLSIPGTRTLFVPAGVGRAGTTAGWTNTGTDMNEALLPASQTNSTFTIPVTGLQVGDTIESFKVIAQIESAGNTATLDADLRRLRNAAADPVDSSLGAITQVSVTADTAVAATKALATATLFASCDAFYVLLKGTTAALTDVRLLGVEVVVRRGN